MKTQLTKEQSQHLLDLGVPKEKASYELIENIYQKEYNEPRPKIFTLTDLLEILPKEIEHSKFYMIWNDGEWDVGYCHYDGEELRPASDLDYNSFKHKPELIDSLYEICVWTIKNKHLKFE